MKKIRGGILATVGYVLSPLSWYNDIFVNIPLVYIFAFPFGLISKTLLMPSMIFGYWLTNVLGFMLMHHGVNDIISKEQKKHTRKEIIKDVLISIIYTLIVIVLINVGWLKFPLEYFQ
ncbi:hypothetical protein A2331_06465 [Candidatus Falkowbacteria bacterium RIFOXYB2_FULL_34_18]|uniref:Uncharacterized protein n=1 Tax=Candidatus Falkowbacteria bacterium RIFOXYD2_FULL_34_120 TaxID=1798007 RepID=A0A1F5TRL2_9BACT|nr:MAG: hypothetical protein A2331_06465 [Candidatus Falkowbacteria bacterium RIFOXYB2_FULL_34_18]OGF29565.1 MAG: hypothetical protein A2500_01630 [Candidatus Falkowbacteria bacterium RIFOXYC12_FULL_34_55]OGF37632.1 MAG: hypothetical protein A2466_01770 [Candidatus Falkowbacteria bacterium RIFOXYC2_FULL_34_220]OGF39279.1 MAG: hypothetical protein A2515_01850 [Candidatus Falkowbacteria bacterium RIFOXYD12_FULL_34_57]OGF41417.1 MAG: hypothetical protein A2531_00015 [Candidatus Falkowbacteria bact